MRRFFSRFLLVVLVGVALFAVVRLAAGSDEPGAVLSVGGLDDPEHLRHDAFRVTAPARLAVHAVGSFETDATLGATAWIVERDSGAVVWAMDPKRVERRRGTLASATDTLLFAPGVYDAYFASFGDPLTRPAEDGGGFFDRLTDLVTRGGRAWHGDAERWQFRVTAVSEADREAVRRLDRDERKSLEEPPAGPGVVWATGPLDDRETREYVFEVKAPARVRLQTVGEVRGGRTRDGGALLRLVDADTVWAMTPRNSVPAGGATMNRRADTTLALAPGLYRALYTTDREHAYGDWVANPPFVPTAWGLTVTTDTPEAVAALDPWGGLPRIASFTCVGEDEEREDTFALPDTTHVLLAALGEVIGSTAYDYAVLLRERPGGGSPEEVWTMSDDNTRPAGGASKNREAQAVLTLAPGTYTLRYVTDGSHDCSDFNADEPPYPDRWGATLFALDPGFDLGGVTRPERAAGLGAGSGPGPGSEVLVRLTGIGNGQRREAAFALDEATDLRVYAVGEIVPSGAYDSGRIRSSGGATVWEMTRGNTRWAGGSKKNRVFDGTLTLPAGRYTVVYETDGSHAYGDWDQSPPNDPAAWGITVWRTGSAVAEAARREAERMEREALERAREAEERALGEVPAPPPPPAPPGTVDG
ncbi:MAG: hypothetical protein R3181_09430 [Rubricoccaceae bacterium]|nr:hypothetical protein [Rubricoccaceae bacterium]